MLITALINLFAYNSFVIQLKADELKDAVGSDYGLWVAQYLVMKRASIEPNFHQLYIDFMDALTIVNLAKEVLKETYRNIKVINLKILIQYSNIKHYYRYLFHDNIVADKVLLRTLRYEDGSGDANGKEQ